VRELEQCLAAGVAFAQGRPIGKEDLPAAVVASLDQQPESRDSSADGLSEPDRRRRAELVASLSRHEGNLADVAREMGKARMQIHRWCKRFGIRPNQFRR
jgi:transcriptional regulator of acetoin/glycerol metabolism